MRFVPFISALALVLAFAIPGLSESRAASTIAAPAQVVPLGEALSGATGDAGLQQAGIRFRLYIGPRYGYYHRRYNLRRRYVPRRRYRRRGYGRCGHWSRRCARNWGYGGSDYYGCLRYHGCR